jgi:hypothetical protein
MRHGHALHLRHSKAAEKVSQNDPGAKGKEREECDGGQLWASRSPVIDIFSWSVAW